MSPAQRCRLSPLAVLSLVLGAVSLSLLGFGGLGILALPLGWLAIRGIHQSEGRLWGRNAALAGMILGAAATVLTLFGIFAEILLPSWEASHKAQCLNNIGVIGLGANKYHGLPNKTPAGEGYFPQAAVPNPDLPPTSRLSWFVELLPHVASADPRRSTGAQVREKIALDQAWNSPANQEAARTNVPTFLCPSSPTCAPREHPGWTTYVGLAGVDPDAAFLPKTDPRAGALGFDRRISRDDVPAGVGYVLLATETIRDNGPWLAAGKPTLRGLPAAATHYIGPNESPFGGCHRGGANAVFLDGSARFIRDNIDPDVFRAMATLAGPQEAVAP